MLEITVLGSGSRGNSTLIRTSSTAILVDAGFSCKQLTLRMAEAAGWSPDKLDGILVSHEHSDHVTGLRVLNKKHTQKVFTAEATWDSKPLLEANLTQREVITAGEKFAIGNIEITPFSIPHDAADPLGFIIEAEGLRFAHLTDIGYPTELARHHLQGCHGVLLESNHDREMIIDGPYPWPVKQRIMSRSGHLNNDDSASLLKDVVHGELQHLWLAHLSQENNCPDLALKSHAEVLKEVGLEKDVKVTINKQNFPSEKTYLG